MSIRKASFKFVTASLCLAVAAGASAAPEPIKIGMSGPFTGGSSPMGVSMRDAIRMAVGEVNAAGGVLGRPLQLVERDDEAKNERGVQVVQEMLHKENIVAGLGIINTGVMLASSRFYQEARIPVLTPGPTGSVVTKQFANEPESYIFRVSLVDNIQAGMIADEARRRGFKKIAILADSTNYGQLGKDDLIAALDKRGLKPVTVEKFNVKDVDMTAQLLRAKSLEADVVLTYGVGPELAQIANGMAKLGWKVPMVGSWTLSMPNFIDNAGANAEGTRFPQTFVVDDTNPKRKAFVDRFKATYKVNQIYGAVWAAQGYDTVYLLVAAIKQANSTDGPKIRDALENLNTKVDGLIMVYDKPFSKADHEAIKDEKPAVMAEIRNGSVVRVVDPK